MTREMAQDAVFKLRTSRGLSVARYLGNLTVNDNGDAEFAGLDSQKGFIVELVRGWVSPFSRGLLFIFKPRPISLTL
jgi:hypothetical protein